ncbi:hypothetical protein BH11PSE10_BH11PSE10_17810 [soil metagenome]
MTVREALRDRSYSGHAALQWSAAHRHTREVTVPARSGYPSPGKLAARAIDQYPPSSRSMMPRGEVSSPPQVAEFKPFNRQHVRRAGTQTC